MRRLRPIKPPRRVTRSEIAQMVRHFERRATGVAAAAELASRRRTAKSERRDRLWTDATSVKESLELSHALYEGGRFTWEEYFFQCAVPIESLQDRHTMDGHYDNKLAPVVSKLRGVEVKHGLEPGQYWPKGRGPAEYDRLNARYEKLLDNEFGKLLREVGLDAHAKLWRGNREEFDRLREAGRASVFEPADLEHATAKLIDMYESEASKCAKARAFYAACAMLGSACEALILLKWLCSR